MSGAIPWSLESLFCQFSRVPNARMIVVLIYCDMVFFFDNDLKVAGEDLRTLPTLRGWLSSCCSTSGDSTYRDMSPKETWAQGCWSCGFVCNFCVDSAKLFQKRFRSRLVKVKARAFSKKSLDFLAQGRLIAYLYIIYRYCMILAFKVASQPSQNLLHLALTPCVTAVCSAKSWSQGHPQCHQNQSDAEMGVIPLQPCEWIWTSAKTMFFTQFSIICWVSDGFTIQDGMLLRYQVCRVFQCQSRKCEVPAPACPETLGEGPREGLAAHIFWSWYVADCKSTMFFCHWACMRLLGLHMSLTWTPQGHSFRRICGSGELELGLISPPEKEDNEDMEWSIVCDTQIMIQKAWSVPERCLLLLFIDLCFMNFIACNNRACNNRCGWFQEHSPLQVPPGMESPVASPSDAPGFWYYDGVRWQKARTFLGCFCMFLLLALVSGWCWWCSCNFNDELIKHRFGQVDS